MHPAQGIQFLRSVSRHDFRASHSASKLLTSSATKITASTRNRKFHLHAGGSSLNHNPKRARGARRTSLTRRVMVGFCHLKMNWMKFPVSERISRCIPFIRCRKQNPGGNLQNCQRSRGSFRDEWIRYWPGSINGLANAAFLLASTVLTSFAMMLWSVIDLV